MLKRTKYSLYHKPRKADDSPLKLPKLSINNQEIKRGSCTKFFGVLPMEIFHGGNICNI